MCFALPFRMMAVSDHFWETTMTDIMDLAERLGKSIADSSQAKALRDARVELNQQPGILQLLQDFQAQSDKIAHLEEENKPIEVEDKRKLQDLHNQLVANDVFKKYTAAQMEYVDLLRKVNETLDAQLAPTEGQDEQ